MNKIIYLLPLFILLSSFNLMAQYQFTTDKKLDCTAIKNQGRTGTCWSFATSSFLESELMRMGKGEHNLSEMHVVKNVYKDKARNYVLRQGKANFSQGSLSHDLIRTAAQQGLMPEDAFSGVLKGEKGHNHGEMEAALKGMLDGVLKQKRLSSKWKKAFNAVLDVYLGESPKSFTYEGKKYSPKEFANSMEINTKDYVNLTSFTHHPFYERFVLEIPDNYSNGSFMNIPIDELENIVDNALKEGFTIAWDGDVSEAGFSAQEGIAVLPVDPKRKDLFKQPAKEINVTQIKRQEAFENYATTDDHLMHLTGIAKDQNGTKYYLIKNSWGEVSEYKGFLYMSAAYFRMKTVAILVHKDAIPKDIAKKMTL